MIAWKENVPFIEPFSLQHLLYILIVSVFLIVMLSKQDAVKDNRERVAVIFLVVSLFQQVLLYSWYAIEMNFDLSEALPFHISRVTSLIGLYFLWSKNLKIVDVLVYFSLFAYGSFLYPQRIYPMNHVIGLTYLISHAVNILLPFFAYIAYGWRPTKRGMIKAYVFFLLYFVFVYLFNPLVDGNYFYLKYRPFFHEWPDICTYQRY